MQPRYQDGVRATRAAFILAASCALLPVLSVLPSHPLWAQDAETTPQPSRELVDQQITSLLGQIETLVEEGHVTSPVGGNAAELFSRVLVLSASASPAGLRTMADFPNALKKRADTEHVAGHTEASVRFEVFSEVASAIIASQGQESDAHSATSADAEPRIDTPRTGDIATRQATTGATSTTDEAAAQTPNLKPEAARSTVALATQPDARNPPPIASSPPSVAPVAASPNRADTSLPAELSPPPAPAVTRQASPPTLPSGPEAQPNSPRIDEASRSSEPSVATQQTGASATRTTDEAAALTPNLKPAPNPPATEASQNAVAITTQRDVHNPPPMASSPPSVTPVALPANRGDTSPPAAFSPPPAPAVTGQASPSTPPSRPEAQPKPPQTDEASRSSEPAAAKQQTAAGEIRTTDEAAAPIPELRPAPNPPAAEAPRNADALVTQPEAHNPPATAGSAPSVLPAAPPANTAATSPPAALSQAPVPAVTGQASPPTPPSKPDAQPNADQGSRSSEPAKIAMLEPTMSPDRAPARAHVETNGAAVESSLSPAMIDAMLKQGEAMLSIGNISAARLLFTRAAESGSGKAAIELGDTYNPIVLAERGVLGPLGDGETAKAWYRKALDFGEPQARQRLKDLGEGEQTEAVGVLSKR